MNKKQVKRLLHAAHLGACIILGMAISGMGEAPLRVLVITGVIFIVLLLTYSKIYGNSFGDEPEPVGDPETPIDNQVRRDLGITD